MHLDELVDIFVSHCEQCKGKETPNYLHQPQIPEHNFTSPLPSQVHFVYYKENSPQGENKMPNLSVMDSAFKHALFATLYEIRLLFTTAKVLKCVLHFRLNVESWSTHGVIFDPAL